MQFVLNSSFEKQHLNMFGSYCDWNDLFYDKYNPLEQIELLEEIKYTPSNVELFRPPVIKEISNLKTRNQKRRSI